MEAAGLLLAGPKANLKAKLTEKARTRPAAMMRQRMPGGASALCKVPKLRDAARASAGGPGSSVPEDQLPRTRQKTRVRVCLTCEVLSVVPVRRVLRRRLPFWEFGSAFTDHAVLKHNL